MRDALVAYAQRATRKGTVEKMSLRAAARDLGVSSGAVYRHFEDKDALLREVVFLGFFELLDRFSRIRPRDSKARDIGTAVYRAYALGLCYFQFAIENPTLWRLMFGRIGVECRDALLADPEHSQYTLFDVAAANTQDLFEVGAIPRPPEEQDVRFAWSALHGAADLTQSGARLDAAEVGAIARGTTKRTLLAIGCPEELIERHAPPEDATFS